MRGFLLEAAGSAPVLRDLPVPAVDGGPLEIVRVRAAGLNPVDLAMAADPALPVPRVVGNEAVVEHRAGLAYAERTVVPAGSLAERAVVDRRILDPLPDDVSPADALAIGIPGIAAWMGLVEVAQLQARETVVVVGATGAVGRIAVQVARLRGAQRVVALGRDAGRLARLTDLGATHTVALGDEDDDARVVEATGGAADVVLDLVYGRPLLSALMATRTGARVVLAGASGAQDATLPFSALRGRTLVGYSNRLADTAPKRVAYRRLLSHLRRGRLQVDPLVFPFERVADAWRLQAATTGNKIVLAL